jgi:hypothetical protein
VVLGPGRSPDFSQPGQVVLEGERPRVPEQHIHRLAEPPEGLIKLRPHVLQFQHAHALDQVALVLYALEEPHRGGMAPLKPGQLVQLGL